MKVSQLIYKHKVIISYSLGYIEQLPKKLQSSGISSKKGPNIIKIHDT